MSQGIELTPQIKSHQLIFKTDVSKDKVSIAAIARLKKIVDNLESSLKWDKFVGSLASCILSFVIGGPVSGAIAISVVVGIFAIQKIAHLYFLHKYNQSVAKLNDLMN